MRSRRRPVGCLLGLALVAGCGGTAAPAADPSPGRSSAAPASATVPVYYVGTTPTGQRLFRELRRVRDGSSVTEALALLGDPTDPDYRTLVAPRSLRVTARDGQLRVVVPPALRARSASASGTAVTLAIQQLAYTAAGVLRRPTPLAFVDQDGRPTTFLGRAPIPSKQGRPAGFSQAPELDVLALVNVERPTQDSRLGRRFTASGRASSFEATVPWEVRDSAGSVVLRGSAMAAGWVDRLYPWRVEVDASSLPAGRYTFVALTDDPTGGEGGGPTSDTKDFTLDGPPARG